MAKLYGVGVGPGDKELITVKAIEVLKKADIIAIPESNNEKGSTAYEIVKPYIKENIETLTLTFPMIKDEKEKESIREKNALLIKQKIDEGKSVCFITLGDPMLYSTFIYLLQNLKQYNIEVETIPGITSFSAMASLLNIPLTIQKEKLTIVCSFDEYVKQLVKLSDTIVFMKVSSYREKLYDLIIENNLLNSFILVSNVGKENQIVSLNPEDLKNSDFSYFTTAIIKK